MFAKETFNVKKTMIVKALIIRSFLLPKRVDIETSGLAIQTNSAYRIKRSAREVLSVTNAFILISQNSLNIEMI